MHEYDGALALPVISKLENDRLGNGVAPRSRQLPP
jgi:hypothetical protein